MAISLSLTALFGAILATASGAASPSHDTARKPKEFLMMADQAEVQMQHTYLGMWVTADGRIRQELLANGRYDEARGNRQSAYQGRYEINGNHIDYWDDTGFTADGVFVSNDELHHGGMVFFRRR